MLYLIINISKPELAVEMLPPIIYPPSLLSITQYPLFDILLEYTLSHIIYCAFKLSGDTIVNKKRIAIKIKLGFKQEFRFKNESELV